ncbi:hypothetical protein XELAEV_18002311mg [Xenopus laevis]|nr:hypothetical protein XELAEV_18002311mg [Xenopus laevis]
MSERGLCVHPNRLKRLPLKGRSFGCVGFTSGSLVWDWHFHKKFMMGLWLHSVHTQQLIQLQPPKRLLLGVRLPLFFHSWAELSLCQTALTAPPPTLT